MQMYSIIANKCMMENTNVKCIIVFYWKELTLDGTIIILSKARAVHDDSGIGMARSCDVLRFGWYFPEKGSCTIMNA